MLLEGYRLEIFRPECNPNFQSLHCLAHLDQDVRDALPYLNAELGGFEYFMEPPAVTFRTHGKIITVHPRQIAVNALRDGDEAVKIVEWLRREINDVWERRAEITPRYMGTPRPKVFEILKLLPRTNCRDCGQATCMVFAVLVAEGAKGGEDCLGMEEDKRKALEEYMRRFSYE